MSIPHPHRRFTIDEYEQMHEAGILKETDRVELIQGEIVEMSPIGARHVASVARGTSHLARSTGPDVLISSQGSILIPDDGEPQPDIVAVRATYDDKEPPTPADIFLVIEVADSSLDYDRNTKLPQYAAAGIPEAWLFNLIANRIERHTDPGPHGYHTVAFAERGNRLSSTILPDVTFDATEMLC